MNNTQSSHSHLNSSMVLSIRFMAEEGNLNDTQLAESFGVSRKTIYNIVNRKTWKDIPEPKTASGYKNYTLFPDGRVYSKNTNSFMTPILRKTGAVVKIRANNGQRRTVSVSELLRKTYGKSVVTA